MNKWKRPRFTKRDIKYIHVVLLAKPLRYKERPEIFNTSTQKIHGRRLIFVNNDLTTYNKQINMTTE